MQKMLWTGAVLTGLLPLAAGGQTTGVSHPEQVPITTSAEGSLQPPASQAAPATPLPTHSMSTPDEPVYRPTPPSVALRARPEQTGLTTGETTGRDALRNPVVASADVQRTGNTGHATVPNVDGLIVGDPIPGVGAVVPVDLDANVVTQVSGGTNELPMGTIFKVRMAQGFSTQETASGTAFSGLLTEPVLREGRVLLPSGSTVNGRVTDVHSGKRVTGPATIHLQPMNVTLPDGTRYKLMAQVIDTDETRRTKVDREGTIVGKDHAKESAAVVGLAAGSGIAAGAMIAGVPGAVVGGVIGAGIATVVWLKHDRQTEVPAGTVVVFQLNSPLIVGGAE